METVFKPGEQVIWINAANVAGRGTVLREFMDDKCHRVELEYQTADYETGEPVVYKASPTVERVGRLTRFNDTHFTS